MQISRINIIQRNWGLAIAATGGATLGPDASPPPPLLDLLKFSLVLGPELSYVHMILMDLFSFPTNAKARTRVKNQSYRPSTGDRA
jgi:hypothetical protein